MRFFVLALIPLALGCESDPDVPWTVPELEVPAAARIDGIDERPNAVEVSWLPSPEGLTQGLGPSTDDAMVLKFSSAGQLDDGQ